MSHIGHSRPTNRSRLPRDVRFRTKSDLFVALVRNDVMGQFQTSLSRSRPIDKPIDFVSQFRKPWEFGAKSAGMEIAAELLSRPSASFERGLSSQRHHVILRAGGAAYADGTDHLAVDHQGITAA
jgi:hypothetical protein